MQGLSSFFEILCWCTIILTIILSFGGNSIVTQNFVLLLQIIFLHVFIGSESLPLTFKIPLSGMSRIQNLNYLTDEHREVIEGWLLNGIVQDSPLKFQVGRRDINFSRAMFPTLLITVGYFIWFLIINAIKKKV